MRNLKNDTIYLQNRKRLIDIKNKLITEGERRRRRNKLGVRDQQIETNVYETDKQ